MSPVRRVAVGPSSQRVRRVLTFLIVALSALAVAARVAVAVPYPVPAVSPGPAAGGPDGPPRPLVGSTPRFGPNRHAPTSPGLTVRQDRRLLRGPFPAQALTRGISDGLQLRARSAQQRAITLSRVLATSARVVRIPVPWNYVTLRRPGPRFDPSDPASGGYRFNLIDNAVRDAVARGLQPLLVVSHAPLWAEAQPVWRYAFAGAWAPDPDALKAFATALARRYSGTFPDPALPGATLPRVTLYQAWNEPNVVRFLAPQWVAVRGRWVAFSPGLYRALLNAFYTGIKQVSAANTVISAGLAPNGDPRDGAGRMTPIRFLRSLLCLTTATSACPDPAHADVIDFHPLSVGNPDVAAPDASDVAIADIAKVTALITRASRLGRLLPAGPKPLSITELNWPAGPGVPSGVPSGHQPMYISRALHRLWVAGATLVAWQFLVDPQGTLTDQFGAALSPLAPNGLYARGASGASSDRPKAFLRGFSFPFDPLRIDAARVRLWSLLPTATTTVVLQERHRGRWVELASLTPSAPGLLNMTFRLTGAARLRLLGGAQASATAVVSGRRCAPAPSRSVRRCVPVTTSSSA